ncbi:MAG TPA: Gfo/Idh/MocA family oxidoreductase [Phycisphaerae bacterium]|nr:Gfo/Idh/MocA family oxidoreductase [Phycisphaerae bacterium]
MKEYRVGFVGFGFIGRVHACGYLNLPLLYDPPPLRARITHVCTSRPETAAKGAAQVGADHAVTDYRQVTENPDVDIVHVCTPNRLHAAALLSAMKHNKHIYCDKPLVADMDEAKAIEAALPDYTATAQMTLQNRFFPATMRARQMIDEGFCGQVLEFRAAYLHAGSADPNAPLKWKLSAAAGGGVIADLAPHVLDLIHFLLGDYDRLLAATQVAYPQRPSADDPSRMVPVDAEDCVMILARMRSGALGTIEATKIATGSEDEIRFEIHGSKGALRFNGMDPHHLEAYDATAPGKPIGGRRGWTRIDTGQRYPAPASGFPGPKFAMGWTRAHAACLANFLQSVADGRPGDPGLDQGIYIQRLIASAKDSARTNAWTAV